MPSSYFTNATMKFLRDLSDHNERDWFEDNKQRYEETVREPALAFIADIAPKLQLVAPRFRAIPKKVGGSLMRVYRDTRFSKDKTPYKTNIGIQFRHEAGKDVHAPGYYLHIEPGGCFLGAGIWRPDSTALGMIRDAIVKKGERWVKARDSKPFKEEFTLEGESLNNPPRGYPGDHPLINDLKRKDFIAVRNLPQKSVLEKHFMAETVDAFARTEPFMRFLCSALEVGFD
ncbi:DUF2461 domain-containing protein [Kaarinaea lacus]